MLKDKNPSSIFNSIANEHLSQSSNSSFKCVPPSTDHRASHGGPRKSIQSRGAIKIAGMAEQGNSPSLEKNPAPAISIMRNHDSSKDSPLKTTMLAVAPLKSDNLQSRVEGIKNRMR
ncbi:hypothetical protein ACLOJK_022017 [Asimina triloba]